MHYFIEGEKLKNGNAETGLDDWMNVSGTKVDNSRGGQMRRHEASAQITSQRHCFSSRLISAPSPK